MSVLDTFYIQYKSNAEEAKKATKEYDKSTKDLEESLKKSTAQSDALGASLLKAVEAGAGLAGAYSALGVIKNAVVSQTDYNRELENTSILTKATIGDLSKVAQMAALASGNKEDRVAALNDMKAMAALAHQLGIRSYKPADQIAAIRQQYQLQSNIPGAQQKLLDIFSTEGMKLLIAKSPDEYADIDAKAGKAVVSDATGKAALSAGQAQVDLAGAEAKLEAKIADGLIPAINRLTGVATAIVASAGGGLIGSLGLAGTYAAAKGAFAAVKWGTLGRAVLGAGGRTAAVSEAANLGGAGFVGAGGLGLAAGSAAFGTGALLVAGPAIGALVGAKIAEHFKDKIISTFAPELNTPMAGPRLMNSIKHGSNDPIMDFFIKKGYNKAQAAGIAANIYAESGGDPSANGYKRGENSYGLAQWHPARAKAIKDGLGIDVYSATKEQQLEAIAWEMNGHRKGFDNGKFKSINGAGEAGGYFSRGFESPLAADKEAMLRGQSAAALASQYHNETTVNIGEITISTQATSVDDIARHIKAATIGACKDVQVNAENARKA